VAVATCEAGAGPGDWREVARPGGPARPREADGDRDGASTADGEGDGAAGPDGARLITGSPGVTAVFRTTRPAPNQARPTASAVPAIQAATAVRTRVMRQSCRTRG
jgi:hypothetical protein